MPRNSGHSDLVQNRICQSNRISRSDHYVDLVSLVRDKHQWTAGGDAQFRAEGMIVRVCMGAKKAVRIGDLAPEVHGLPLHRLASQQLDVSLLR